MVSELKPTWPGVKYAEHQEFGIRWMLNQELVGVKAASPLAQLNGEAAPEITVRGGILGDEMGLGKTIQALALICNNKVKRTLIITPLAVRAQWEEAVAKCDLNLFTAEKGVWKSHGRILTSRPDVYLGHYDKLVLDFSLFQIFTWSRVILDEAQRIRNHSNSTGAKIASLKADYKWCLTATPIVNAMKDATNYLRFVGFPTLDSGAWQPVYESWVKSSYLARSIHECEPPAGLTMPTPPIVETRSLDFSNQDEQVVYDSVYKNLESQWRKASALAGNAYQLAMFSILLRLRQISVNPQIYINARKKENYGWTGPEFALPSRKFDEIAYLLQEASLEPQANAKHGWIIFCQFHEEMEMMSQFLKGLSCVGKVQLYHGGMNLKSRGEVIEKSKSFSGKQDILLIQLQAGGTGLNLQHYDRVIFVSPWWTSALLDQALGRVQRIGQKNQVKVYWLRLKAEGLFNIDQFIMEKADTKRDLGKKFKSWSVKPEEESGDPVGLEEDDFTEGEDPE